MARKNKLMYYRTYTFINKPLCDQAFSLMLDKTGPYVGLGFEGDLSVEVATTVLETFESLEKLLREAGLQFTTGEPKDESPV